MLFQKLCSNCVIKISISMMKNTTTTINLKIASKSRNQLRCKFFFFFLNWLKMKHFIKMLRDPSADSFIQFGKHLNDVNIMVGEIMMTWWFLSCAIQKWTLDKVIIWIRLFRFYCHNLNHFLFGLSFIMAPKFIMEEEFNKIKLILTDQWSILKPIIK